MTTSTDINSSADVQQIVTELSARMDALEKSQGNDRLSIGVMSGNLDTTMAAFIIALGAVAFDIEVNMFFTFWASAALAIRGSRPPRSSSTACSVGCSLRARAHCR